MATQQKNTVIPTGDAYPGRLIKTGDLDKTIVLKIQQRLNAMGCGPVPEDGIFDKGKTLTAIKLFQARFSDVTGAPLVVDGKVGSLTWGALFGANTVPSITHAPSDLTKAVIEFARSQVGVMEDPTGSNRGPEVNEYLKAVGLDATGGSYPWCVAFTHYCYSKAAKQLGLNDNPHIRTAGVLDHWSKAAKKPNAVRIKSDSAINSPELVKPGSLFIIDLGKGTGHSGIVIENANGRLITIEGNTNDNGSREGIGVFLRNSRKIASINRGFIDYSAF